jgi:hypothetical protein
MTLAFAVPAQTTQLKVQLRPSGAEPGVVTYCGDA